MPPITTMDYVDLDRFMGKWYVIGVIPTPLEKNIFNAVEEYRLDDDGTIATTFTFNKGALDGKQKSYTPRGFVFDSESNAVWGMRFIWPIKADYRIVYVDENYDYTIIGRNKRDFVWIMARDSAIDDTVYSALVERVAAEGYDTELIQLIPHQNTTK